MQQYKKNLGKVSLTSEGAWAINKSFEILSIVYDENTKQGFISRKDVPIGVDINNREYWMPLNVSGYADNNIIILSEKTSDTNIKSYTLEEAINSIASVGRKPGVILGFYNENSDRLDIGGRWEVWQFNSTTISEWEDISHWQNIYYNYNKFVGWYKSENSLKKYNPFPEIGCYAFVGTELNEATVYRCDKKYVWEDTTQHAWDYIKVIINGTVTVGENGNWFNNGVDTKIPASVKGENGKTPIFRNNNNIIEFSYDNKSWKPISDEIAAWFRWESKGGQQAFSIGKIQITRNGVTWTDLSGEFVNNLRISRYIGADESLPTSGIVEGTIYAKGPTYADEDTSHSNPIYRLWVYAWKGNTLAWQDNGEFQSIVAGVVQETGNSETEVMSQKAVTDELSELGSYVSNPEYARAYTDAEGRFLWGIKHDGSIEFAKGVPTPIKAYIDSLDRNNDEEVERINQLVIGLLADVKVLTDTYHYISNPEWACAIVDSEERILMGIKADGSYYIPNREMYHVESNPEYAKAVVDSEGRVLFGIKVDGSCYIPKGISEEAKKGLLELTTRISWFETDENPEWLQVTTDSEGRVLEGFKNDGKKYYPKQEMLEKYNDPEGRTEMTLDADGKILSYRDSDGTKHEAKMSINDSLSLGIGAMSDLQKALRESGFNVDNPIDWSNEKTISLPIPRYCAKVNIISETGLATTKTQDKKCVLQYWDKSGNYFLKYIILNAQGSSSMNYKEKNQSIDVFNDKACEESCDIVFGNWVAQDSFHLKCYYIDVFRGIANVGYNYCEEIIQYLNCRNNRIALDNSPITKNNSTGDFDIDFGDDALCHPDGFPFEMYVNGEYYGLFAWNLKKHRKNYSMDKKDYTSTILDGVIDYDTFFLGTIDWTKFELRNPKDLVTMDGREYDADKNRNELIDATSSYYNSLDPLHVNTAKLKELIVRQSSAITLIKNEESVELAKEIYEQHYDIDAVMCYFIASNILYNYDGFRKNWIWTIYGNIASPTFYDMDSIFGRHWNGTCVVEESITKILGIASNLPTGQLIRLYKEYVDKIYAELRNAKIVDVANIMTYVTNWTKRVGLDAYERNIDAWSSIPSYRYEKTEDDGTAEGGFYDSPKRIELWLVERIANLDTYFNYNV